MADIETELLDLVGFLKKAAWVRAAGLSGGGRPYPHPGQGDLDVFIYCAEIPAAKNRLEFLAPIAGRIAPLEAGLLAGGHFGQGDCCQLAGVETWLLYFSADSARGELDDLLAGKQLERLDNYYYPLGRCAMWASMRSLYDPDGLLASFKKRLEIYPDGLARKLLDHHLSALRDEEDLERAALRRDALFYHFALDLALDHFLQALFALNRAYFPSRKRSEQHIEDFRVKPADYAARLRQVLALGADPARLPESLAHWQSLVRELEGLAVD